MKVVFLDRDGTIVREPEDERIDSIEKIDLFADSLTALQYLANNGFVAIIVTNQAGIAEGRMTEANFWDINNEILTRLAPSGIKILKTYMNGESRNAKASEWRKPGPKMLQQAARDFDLNLKDMYIIGDRETDVQAGVNASCKGGILLKTSRDEDFRDTKATYLADNLLDAARYVVMNTKQL